MRCRAFAPLACVNIPTGHVVLRCENGVGLLP